MTKFELYFILFPINYLKEIITHEMNKLLKHIMGLGEFIWWLVYWFYLGFWVGTLNRRNWWSTSEPKMS